MCKNLGLRHLMSQVQSLIIYQPQKATKTKLHITPIFVTIHYFSTVLAASALSHGLRRRKKMKRSADDHRRRWYGEKKRCREGQRGAYRHQSLIIYRPSLSPPMPNHLSTPHSRHQSLIICLPINFTNFTTHFLVSMTVREGWKRGGWKRCESGVEG